MQVYSLQQLVNLAYLVLPPPARLAVVP